ncbi:histone protein [Streptomyces sp. NPDC002574]|uniref:histone protein n=1 Tax=Streptomyces sp. NPDC002574 TaxID=3364652 RepID=UPI0036B5F76C
MADVPKVALAAAVLGGYVLGRTKKGRVAFGMATYLAGRRFGLQPQQLLTEGAKRIRELPQFADLNEQLRGEALDAGRKALRAVADRKLADFADSLHQRTERIGSKGKDQPQDDDEELGDEYEEEEEPEDEEPEEEGDEEAEDEYEENEEEEPKEEDEEPEKPAPRRRPAARRPDEDDDRGTRRGHGRERHPERAATSKTPAKKSAPAKKAVAKKSAPAKKTTAARKSSAQPEKGAAKKTAAKKASPGRRR